MEVSAYTYYLQIFTSLLSTLVYLQTKDATFSSISIKMTKIQESV